MTARSSLPSSPRPRPAAARAAAPPRPGRCRWPPRPGGAAVPADVVYGIGRIDASGRIGDRAVISALGWRGGDRLTLTADAGVVTARRDPGGMVTLPPAAYITIPAALRRRCGLEPGDRVLLAAVPGRGHPHRLLPRRGGPGHPRPRRVPARARRTTMTHRPPRSGRVPAGRRGRGAAGPGVDGPVPGRPDRRPGGRPPVPTFAEYVPVVSAAVTDGTRAGVRLLLEPDHRAVGRPAPGRADAVGDPAARGARQGQRRCPAATPAAGAAPPSTSSPRCAACTGTPRTTG